MAGRLAWRPFLGASFLDAVINGVVKVIRGSLPRLPAFPCRLCPTFNQFLERVDVTCPLIDIFPHELVSVRGRPRVTTSPADKDLGMIF